MRDDIYSLCQLLQPNQRTGTAAKIAIFTENGAIVMTSESCQSLIQQAIQQGSQTHIADQVGGACYATHQQLWHHCHRLTLLHTPHISIVCIRGVRGTVSADCRWTSNYQTVHVSKLYIATVWSLKTSTAAHRLHVHLPAIIRPAITSQRTFLCHLALAFIHLMIRNLFLCTDPFMR